MIDKIEIRDVLHEDKEGVLRFCQQTWEWGDYIGQAWDAWLSDPCGRLVVGIFENLPVAVAHLTMLAPGEAWLEGLRVAPDYRNRGVGGLVGQHCVRAATEMGAIVIRFMTLASNMAACRIAARLGFLQVASFLPYWADSEKGSSQLLTTLEPKNLEDLLAFIEGSDIYRSVSGLYCTGWAYHKLTEEKLRRHLERGDVLTLEQGELLRALAVVTTSPLDQGIVVGYVDARPEVLSDLALALKALAGKTGHPRVEARLPDLSQVCGAFSRAGYTPYFDEPFPVFQLNPGTKDI